MDQTRKREESAWHQSAREETTIFLGPGGGEQDRQEQGAFPIILP